MKLFSRKKELPKKKKVWTRTTEVTEVVEDWELPDMDSGSTRHETPEPPPAAQSEPAEGGEDVVNDAVEHVFDKNRQAPPKAA